MILIDKYFRSKADKLAYLELKNEREKYIDYGLNDIALPIISDDLMTALSQNEFEKEVNSKFIVDGMLYNIGVDHEFKYAPDYKNVLKNMVKTPSEFAVSRGIEFLENDIEKAIVFFRAGYLLDEANNFAAYNYSRLLWRLEVDEDTKQECVSESIRILEKTISNDSEFALGYYELGNIYRNLGEFLKSMNYYRNTLERVDIESIKDEVRNQITEIEPDALVEDAIHFINKMNYAKAIELLNEATKKSSRYDVTYYLAVCYMNLESFELADEYFEKAIKEGADFAMLYIDYIYVKYTRGQVLEALQIANDALDKYPTDLKIRYNRALILVELDMPSKALEDIDFILEYDDLSYEFRQQLLMIKENIV